MQRRWVLHGRLIGHKCCMHPLDAGEGDGEQLRCVFTQVSAAGSACSHACAVGPLSPPCCCAFQAALMRSNASGRTRPNCCRCTSSAMLGCCTPCRSPPPPHPCPQLDPRDHARPFQFAVQVVGDNQYSGGWHEWLVSAAAQLEALCAAGGAPGCARALQRPLAHGLRRVNRSARPPLPAAPQCKRASRRWRACSRCWRSSMAAAASARLCAACGASSRRWCRRRCSSSSSSSRRGRQAVRRRRPWRPAERPRRLAAAGGTCMLQMTTDDGR